ncbi:hypothetical protein EEL52_10965 [Muribaculaceae bacterium Isolate-113 (HZI)]|uniref:hypothetical protein n=1 Tax=Sangeribacter muris TaxID=2880703 RepID=UPI000F482F39|nr:hypothetical protein [Sangeribacter muris]MBJ2192863.1 hypothetical protein [Muribaculaceae bacterium]ROS83996.1 hypothetical protein EEK90_06080 [Muribaculaceae bacterium Isolate-036 (Harlan)]ROT18830.1 hypothetical protein EEL53_11590 [Muribaculaceae bacterium Isolate-114 (HZI)]ROT20071.1 hypothetical protein EEL52_10965 [Muribaculaceae bacterium Isolate-113 (HZI)]RXE69403.1 hypothetical protein ED328_02315 [Muribaculaceae bacterium Isolate-001 (NCI)]
MKKAGFTITRSRRPLLDRMFEPLKSNRSFRFIYLLAGLNGFLFGIYFLLKGTGLSGWECVRNWAFSAGCFCIFFALGWIYRRWYNTSKSKCFARNLTDEEIKGREPVFEPCAFGGITFRLQNPRNLDGERFTEIYGTKEESDR